MKHRVLLNSSVIWRERNYGYHSQYLLVTVTKHVEVES